MNKSAYDAVLLLSYGAPERPEEVRPFLRRLSGSRSIPEKRLREVEKHYDAVGGRSPLNELTNRQADALQAKLRRDGVEIPVRVGMRNWSPFIADTLNKLALEGARRVLALIMSPFHSGEAGLAAYRDAVNQALIELAEKAPVIDYGPAFGVSPGFVQANADNVVRSMHDLGPDELKRTAILFTAHSVPDFGPGATLYARQFGLCARLIAETIDFPRYAAAYQSRTGSPSEKWLEPSVEQAMRKQAEKGIKHLVVSPIGFVCDHVEVLYDLDIQARGTAETLGLKFRRTPAVHDHPAFIDELARLVVLEHRTY
jgi:ferrochelatase